MDLLQSTRPLLGHRLEASLERFWRLLQQTVLSGTQLPAEPRERRRIRVNNITALTLGLNGLLYVPVMLFLGHPVPRLAQCSASCS